MVVSLKSQKSTRMNRETLINLRRALAFAEQELGLSKFSEHEKKLYYAAAECCDAKGFFSSEEIRKSNWCKDIPHATYHRLLSRLIDAGVFGKRDGRLRNSYTLNALR